MSVQSLLLTLPVVGSLVKKAVRLSSAKPFSSASEDPVPFHLRSQLAWLLTLPNILTYVRFFVQMYSCLLYDQGHSLAPLWAILFNQCILDVLDGPLARTFGCCTGVGKYLDIGTDYFAIGLFFP